jgi:FAD/FMN-containing dehydrogenase
MGREAFLAEVRRTLPGILEEGDGGAVLLPRSAHELVVATRLARRLEGRVTPPGGPPRPEAVPLDLRRLGDVLAFDDVSRIVHVQAGCPVGTVEAALLGRGLTLGLTTPRAPDLDVGEWLALGAPGARDPDDDPVDQHVAGVELVLPDGQELAIRPAPRRAVGPDLLGAVVGGRGALGVLLGAHLVARPHRAGHDLAFLFADDQAVAARAWIRGRGVRPARTHIAQVPEGQILYLRIEGTGPVARASMAVSERTARERGGVPFPPDEVPPPPVTAPRAAPDIVERLAAAYARGASSP